MPHLAHILLRILAGIAGALLLYVAFFLYEDEEARIQNRLEEIWKRIDALQTRAMSKEAAFMHGVTRITSAILDRLSTTFFQRSPSRFPWRIRWPLFLSG